MAAGDGHLPVLPRKMQLPVPAPSFVEACLGETNPTPSREAIEAATAMLVRLIDAGDVVALNLWEWPVNSRIFLVTPDFLPYIFALRGDRDWKHDPHTSGTGRVSPLVFEVWKAIERTGVQTAIEIRETLGKELTEAAVLRGLHELWTGLRMILLPGENGEPATWEALKTRHEKACAKGTASRRLRRSRFCWRDTCSPQSRPPAKKRRFFSPRLPPAARFAR